VDIILALFGRVIIFIWLVLFNFLGAIIRWVLSNMMNLITRKSKITFKDVYMKYTSSNSIIGATIVIIIPFLYVIFNWMESM